MPDNADHKKAKLIDRIVAQANARLHGEPGGVVERFLARYYENVPPFDLLEEGEESLFGAAVAHWKLAARRKRGEPRVRVYTPNLEEHGWRSEHTIIEVVTDDMPFLVDSVTADLNSKELDLILSVHPVYRVIRDGDGNLLDVDRPDGGGDGDGAANESFMHFKIAEQATSRLDTIRDGILAILTQVHFAVQDWSAMRARSRPTRPPARSSSTSRRSG